MYGVRLAIGNPNFLHFLLGWSPLFAQTPCLLWESSPPLTGDSMVPCHSRYSLERNTVSTTVWETFPVWLKPTSSVSRWSLNAIVHLCDRLSWQVLACWPRFTKWHIFGGMAVLQCWQKFNLKGVMCLWTTYPPSHHFEVPWHNPTGTNLTRNQTIALSTSMTRAFHLFELTFSAIES